MTRLARIIGLVLLPAPVAALQFSPVQPRGVYGGVGGSEFVFAIDRIVYGTQLPPFRVGGIHHQIQAVAVSTRVSESHFSLGRRRSSPDPWLRRPSVWEDRSDGFFVREQRGWETRMEGATVRFEEIRHPAACRLDDPVEMVDAPVE